MEEEDSVEFRFKKGKRQSNEESIIITMISFEPILGLSGELEA